MWHRSPRHCIWRRLELERHADNRAVSAHRKAYAGGLRRVRSTSRRSPPPGGWGRNRSRGELGAHHRSGRAKAAVAIAIVIILGRRPRLGRRARSERGNRERRGYSARNGRALAPRIRGTVRARRLRTEQVSQNVPVVSLRRRRPRRPVVALETVPSFVCVLPAHPGSASARNTMPG